MLFALMITCTIMVLMYPDSVMQVHDFLQRSGLVQGVRLLAMLRDNAAGLWNGREQAMQAVQRQLYMVIESVKGATLWAESA
jgi:hypothetical protein